MATEQCRVRTNYFAVTDKEAFKDLVDRLVTGDDDSARFIENSRGEVGFCCNDVIYGLKPDGVKLSTNVDYDTMESEMIKQIQALLSPDHACIITGIEWEILRSVNGFALIITKDDYNFIDMRESALALARTMLADNKYSPDMIL